MNRNILEVEKSLNSMLIEIEWIKKQIKEINELNIKKNHLFTNKNNIKNLLIKLSKDKLIGLSNEEKRGYKLAIKEIKHKIF